VPLDKLSDLKGFARRPFPVFYPAESQMVFFPGDMLIQVFANMIHSAESSLVMSGIAINEVEINDVLVQKLNSKDVYVQLMLDEHLIPETLRPLIKKLGGMPTNNIVYGAGLYEAMVVDGLDVLHCGTGSEVIVTREPLIAARWRTQLDLEHTALCKAGGRVE
jgi:hypothetical protein